MGQVIVRLFGLRDGHSRLNKFSEVIGSETTVQDLWSRIQSTAKPGERLATVDPKALLVLVNGRPVHLLGGWQARLNDRDEVTFMLKVAGG